MNRMIGNGKVKIPISRMASSLEYIGPVLRDDRYHYWCTSAVIGDDGKTHLFTSRVPYDKDVPFENGWKINCEIAHFTGDSPEGPFREEETVFSNSNLPEGKMWSPHNSKIRKIDGIHCLLFIVQTSPSVETQKTVLATSESLYGPWKMQGENNFILDFDKRNVNPDLIKIKNKYYLYFKTKKNATVSFYYAVSDNLTGPYKISDTPIVDGMTVEDLNVFSFRDKIYMLSTDNFGASGYDGAGLLWRSDNGTGFSWEDTELGFGKMNDYIDLPETRTLNYGSRWDKHERPDVLFVGGKPAYLYVTGGTSIDGLRTCQNYIYKINKF